MKIVDGVYFFESGDNTYLRNVNNAQDYLFNAIVFDILTIIKNNPDCGLEFLCQELTQIYDIEDKEELYNDLTFFIEELTENGVIICPKEKEKAVSESIADIVSAERGKNRKLYSAALELTYRCNEKCIHCYVDDAPVDDKNELSFDEYKMILHQLKELGCISLLLTGGEVCLNKDFIDIARYAASLGFLVDIYTNGIAMTDEQFEALCDMKVNSVSFSLYAGDAAAHDAITKVPGSFDKTLKRAMMFKCAGVDTYIKSVAIKQNIEHLEGLYKLGERIGIKINVGTVIVNTHSGVDANCFRLETQEQRRKVLEVAKKYDTATETSGERDLNEPICSAGINSLSIDPYGGVHPCLIFSTEVASVREVPIKDIWDNNPFINSLRKLRFTDLGGKCRSCKHLRKCTVCIGSAYGEFGTLCTNADACDWTEMRHEIANSNFSCN